MATKITRKMAVRQSFVGLAVLVYFATLGIEAKYGIQAQDSMQWLLGLIAAAVLGDTYRPSGYMSATTPGGSSSDAQSA